MFPQLSVAENIFMGSSLKRESSHKVDWKRLNRAAQQALNMLDVDLDVNIPVGEMSVANQQLVQIARATVFGADIMIFDEPTASLTLNEGHKLLELIKRFRGEGKAIIFVSHHMDEVMDISDRASIMRNGKLIETISKDEVSFQRLIKGMAGREVEYKKVERDVKGEACVLSVRGLSKKKEFEDINFDVKKGEILGIAGLVGAGRTEMVSSIFGANKLDSGEITVEGKAVTIKNPKQAIELGIGYLPEERRNYCIIPQLSVRENLSIASVWRLFKFPKIDRRAEKRLVDNYISRVRIKVSDVEASISQLSGGNQQKVILSRWLAVGAKILILDEPTRGIDVLAKDEIHSLIRECADGGMAAVVVSSEMEELINLCNRILIMHEGKCKGIVDAEEMDPERILNIALR